MKGKMIWHVSFQKSAKFRIYSQKYAKFARNLHCFVLGKKPGYTIYLNNNNCDDL